MLLGRPGATARAAADRLVAGGVAVDVREGGQVPTDFSRQNDSDPYYAGARSVTLGVCTLGFGVVQLFAPRLLYAGHCVNANGSGVYEDPDTNGGNDVLIGTAVGLSRQRDIVLVDGPAAGRVWDGGVFSEDHRPVRGATRSRVGNLMCSSGSLSGVQCGIQVDQVDQAIFSKFPVVLAHRLGGGQAAGQGDSGGPLFELPYFDDGSRIAKGVILGGGVNGTQPCTIGERTIPGTGVARRCSNEIHYADVVTTLEAYSAKILTDFTLPGGAGRPASLSGDTNAELVGVNNNGDGGINVWYNNGAARWSGPTGVGSNWYHPAVVRFADLDGDRQEDLIGVNNNGDGVINAWRNVNGATGVWEGPYPIGSGWFRSENATFADIDGDGRDDLIGLNLNGEGRITAWRNNGRAFHEWPWGEAKQIGSGWYNPAVVRFADLNGDGFDDLIGVNNNGDGHLNAWWNNQQAWAWPWNGPFEIGSHWFDPAVAQFA